MLMRNSLLWLLTLVAGQAAAWGGDGHRLIAELAEQQLTPAARQEINRLLALEPGSTLASVSSWADEVKNRRTARWHFVNLPDDCTYVHSRDCPGGACVIQAIQGQRTLLASPAPDEARLRALKFVVHLVGDVHQPLHASMAADKGGGQFQVQAFSRGSNLHKVWDSELIKHYPGGLLALRKDVMAAMGQVQSTGTEVEWGQESCRAVRQEGFYPAGREVGAEYAGQQRALLVQRLTQGARRLAGVLNSAARGAVD